MEIDEIEDDDEVLPPKPSIFVGHSLIICVTLPSFIEALKTYMWEIIENPASSLVASFLCPFFRASLRPTTLRAHYSPAVVGSFQVRDRFPYRHRVFSAPIFC